jgi:hypothetical protein
MKKTVEFTGVDGQPYTFKACINDMSGSQMHWIEKDGKCHGGMFVGGVTSTLNAIRKNCVITSEVGTCDHQLAR